MSGIGQTAKDLALTNLVVTGTSVHNNLVANTIKTNNLDLPVNFIDIVPSSSFVLDMNGSISQGRMVTICFSGVVTGDIGVTVLPIATIDPSLAPPINILIPAACTTPFGILIAQIKPTGEIETCLTGAPFPFGSYTLNFSATYLKL